jgi:hypothetical protein
MNADLTWLQQFGTSVVNQQAGVMDAIQSFRKKVLDAGNLKSDDKQNVSVQSGGSGAGQVIVIEPAKPQVIYVPTYEPATVIYAAPPGYPYPFYPYYWSAPYPYYYDPAAPFSMGAFVGVAIGFGCSWSDHDIYRGDINIDNININRNEVRQRIENRQNSNVANQIRRNPENVWRPDRSALKRAQSGGGTASRLALEQSTAAGQGIGAGAVARSDGAPGDGFSRPGGLDLTDRSSMTDFGVDRSYRGSSQGAFSDIDRGAAASRFSARGAGSMGGGFRGGGYRGGGGRR